MRRKRNISNFATTAVDRISECPDSILVHILSFLPIEDAVKTGALSKRWRFLWTFIPSLLFRSPLSDSSVADSEEEDTRVARGNDFVTFVDKTLFFSNCSKLKKLGVDFEYSPCFASNVNSWTQFAAGKGVEELHLEFHSAESYLDEYELYELPQLLYDNSWFKELRFSLCRVIPKRNVAWYSLKKLSIGYVRLRNDVIGRILSGSPALETLELHHCEGFSRLNVTNPGVKKLILRDFSCCWSEEIGSELEISAPNLLSLEISGFLWRNCRVMNVSSLVDAVFNCNFEDFEEDWLNDNERIQNFVAGVFASLLHVKNLTLGNWAIEVLSIMEIKGLSSPLLNCKCLTLSTTMNKYALPGIASVLKSTPNLETLVMTLPLSSLWALDFDVEELRNYNEEQFWISQNCTCKCLTLHLKTVTFDGNLMMSHFRDFKLFPFVKFLLRNAKVLQKMVFRKPSDDRLKEIFVVAQKLLSFPRSSPDAAVIFC